MIRQAFDQILTKSIWLCIKFMKEERSSFDPQYVNESEASVILGSVLLPKGVAQRNMWIAQI